MEEELSQLGKQPVRYAILRLTKEGKIKRVRGFGSRGIEYYYKSL
jgi:DNA-binding GntR family transcriptional regulator